MKGKNPCQKIGYKDTLNKLIFIFQLPTFLNTEILLSVKCLNYFLARRSLTWLYVKLPNMHYSKLTKSKYYKHFLFLILIFSGYHACPGERYYWDSQSDMNQQCIVNAIRHYKLDLVMSSIDTVDNTNLNQRDKLYRCDQLSLNCNISSSNTLFQ